MAQARSRFRPSRAERAAWEDAVRVARQAAELLHGELSTVVAGVRAGQRDAIEWAIAYLEVDPWAFRSGYAKASLLQALKQATLTTDNERRLRAVILAVVDKGDRREFREYCRLAKRIVNDELRGELLDRLRGTDRGRARRALWILSLLDEPLDGDDRLRVQAIVELAAADPEWWRAHRWAGRLAARYRDDAWGQRILERALHGDGESVPALRLLEYLGMEPSASQRAALGARILDELRHGDPTTGWIEPVAVIADSPGLRAALVEIHASATDETVQKYTWWAINAISRYGEGGWPDLDRS